MAYTLGGSIIHNLGFGHSNDITRAVATEWPSSPTICTIGCIVTSEYYLVICKASGFVLQETGSFGLYKEGEGNNQTYQLSLPC